MNKELHYTGYATEPSDYECPDGQLALSLNLISEDSQVKPLLQPKALLQMPDGMRVVYVHNTTHKHYIVYDDDNLALYSLPASIINTDTLPVDSTTVSGAMGQPIHTFDTGTLLNSVTAVGNTLIVLTSTGIHYILWKGDTEGYKYLGNHLPELPMSFGLEAEMVRTDEFKVDFAHSINASYSNDRWIFDNGAEFDNDNKTAITDAVLAKVNKFIAEKTAEGKFLFPFFVRYAFRLYDGSLTMHSAPVLMICSSDVTPVVYWTDLDSTGDKSSAKLIVCAPVHTLDYAVLDPNAITAMSEWEDIVKSVDIFVSLPLYTYDQNGQCTKFIDREDDTTYAVCKHTNQWLELAPESTYPKQYQKNLFTKLYAFTFAYDTSPVSFVYPKARLVIPARNTEQIKADIRSTSNFYLVKSLKLQELSASRRNISPEKDYLLTLPARELMTDDYDSHDQLIPDYAFPYNQRLNVANISKALYNSYHTGALFPFTDGYVDHYSDGVSPTAANVLSTYKVWFFIKQDGKDIVVRGEDMQFSVVMPMLFFYYPNTNAYKAVFYGYVPAVGNRYHEVALEAHTGLNGAFYFGGWENVAAKPADYPQPTESTDRSVSLPNKIYTSEVNNPFHFPVSGINTVGTGTIIGISAAAKAMSQGQFGQFPLYAFATDGVWALEVSSNGTYSAKQPITRDVCTNTHSITQIDSSVLFATNRGIMLLSGSNATCITDSINAEHPFDVTTLPHFDALHTLLHPSTDTCIPTQPFLQYTDGCRMIFDYTHQRIILFNPASTTYAYVYSLRSQAWGMMYSELQEPVNDYPDALAMTHDGELVTFSKAEADEIGGLLVTRPLKLDTPDALKTISAIIQRGHFRRGDVKVALYASRNLYGWHLVWTSQDQYLRGFRGTPFKYFRIALVTTLSDGKSLFGASIDYTPRHTNQIR